MKKLIIFLLGVLFISCEPVTEGIVKGVNTAGYSVGDTIYLKGTGVPLGVFVAIDTEKQHSQQNDSIIKNLFLNESYKVNVVNNTLSDLVHYSFQFQTLKVKVVYTKPIPFKQTEEWQYWALRKDGSHLHINEWLNEDHRLSQSTYQLIKDICQKEYNLTK